MGLHPSARNGRLDELRTGQDLPLDAQVVFFDGVEFETSSPDGWTLVVNVVEHCNGRLYHVSHDSVGSESIPASMVAVTSTACVGRRDPCKCDESGAIPEFKLEIGEQPRVGSRRVQPLRGPSSKCPLRLA